MKTDNRTKEEIAKDVNEYKTYLKTKHNKQEVFERSKRAEELRKQGNVSDMFKTMFGQQ